MASIYDQPPLSPAQLTKRLIEQARERAEKEEWEQYEEENRRLNGIRFKPTRAKPTKHGTRQGYGKGCRCDPCKKANSDYLKEYRLKKGITKSNRDGRKYAHGTYYSYQYGKCRCDLLQTIVSNSSLPVLAFVIVTTEGEIEYRSLASREDLVGILRSAADALAQDFDD
jgi:hypothetical protein